MENVEFFFHILMNKRPSFDQCWTKEFSNSKAVAFWRLILYQKKRLVVRTFEPPPRSIKLNQKLVLNLTYFQVFSRRKVNPMKNLFSDRKHNRTIFIFGRGIEKIVSTWLGNRLAKAYASVLGDRVYKTQKCWVYILYGCLLNNVSK